MNTRANQQETGTSRRSIVSSVGRKAHYYSPAMSRGRHTSQKSTPGTKGNLQLDSSEDGGNNSNIEKMLSSILSELKTLKQQNEENRKETKKDISELKMEIKGLDKRIEEKCCHLESKIGNIENTFHEKINHLTGELTRLQETEERRQRKERKNNIVIKSKEFGDRTESDQNEKVKKILQEIESDVEFSKTTFIGKNTMGMGLVRVELNNLEDKIKIMKNKNKLKGQDRYIDDDMTRQEREIQSALRKRAREEKEKGNEAKVGYQKLLINNNWVNWKDLQGKPTT